VIPTFEDGHFVGRYLLGEADSQVGFCARARYCYRKRADQSSSVDRAWRRAERYDDVLRYGYRDLFNCALAQHGRLPAWVQRTVLYDLGWFVRRIVDTPATTRFLTPAQVSTFKEHLRALFDRIDPEVIQNFPHPGIWFLHKVGMLGLFKGAAPSLQICYVEDYDGVRNSVLIRYFFYDQAPLEAVLLDGKPAHPTDAKTRVYRFLDEEFVRERIAWIDVTDAKKLSVHLDGRNARITLRSTQYRSGIELKTIRNAFRPGKLDDRNFPPRVKALRRLARLPAMTRRYADAWVFMDRDVQADDNAEHLYRWVRQNRPELNAFFVLRKTSHDWSRLERDGFRLLKFGGMQHKLALLNARHVVSSHADDYVHSFLTRRRFSDMIRYKFTFLQHGVISVDLSSWLNRQPISLFVTSTEGEYESIAGSGNHYRFTPREVALTGLPRHDSLLKKGGGREKVVLVMPTWRQSIVGARIGKGNERSQNPAFALTEFAQRWKGLLRSEEFLGAARERGYRIVFFPHANIQPYISWFDLPPEVEVRMHDHSTSFQDIFQKSSVLVTDYSSVAFEMAVLMRPVIYYQFDRDTIFSGDHIYAPGYFDHRTEGFGPVCYEQAEVVTALSNIMSNDGTPDPVYAARMRDTIRYRDGENCRRVFDRIVAMERRRTLEDASRDAVPDELLRATAAE
jgi:hypothetical protein